LHPASVSVDVIQRATRRPRASYGAIVAPLLLSLLMSAIVSAISLVRSQGFDARVLDLWPGA
jgi:hypothetical protein